jgi:hypothetical protein
MDIRQSLWNEINLEREYQDQQWGAAHDDKHTRGAWLLLILRYLGRAANPELTYGYRAMLLKVVALTVAALEAEDRKAL